MGTSMKSPSADLRPLSERIPDHFKDEDDSHIDYAAPMKEIGPGDSNMHYMQQSLIGMIAAVGSRSDFRGRFDNLSDSDSEPEEPSFQEDTTSKVSNRELSSDRHPVSDNSEPKSIEGRGRRHRRTTSENKLLWRRPDLSLNDKQTEVSSLSGSTITIQPRRARSATPRAPVLTRMVQAQDRFVKAPAPEHLPSRPSSPSEDRPQTAGSALSTRLMEMFGFERPEKVLVEYACSLLQSMLLQGYMYVTEGHVCFYAYLPKKSSVAMKSGFLAKRGKNNPKYNRYWFVLKGDVLSYYADSSNLYFPSGHVDLRYGISASLGESKTKGPEIKDFQVTTDQGTYSFRAESHASAKEWVKSLQQVIFRSHNEGDSVKVSFPIENVIDIEESPMTEFAKTFKIRVVDSGESFAIDEVSQYLPNPRERR